MLQDGLELRPDHPRMTDNLSVTADRLGRIVEEAASEVYIFSADDFLFRLVNKGARDNLGYTIEELMALTPWDIKPYISQSDFIQMVEPLQTGSTERLDFATIHRRKDGSFYNVDVRLQIFEEDGDRVFYAAIQDTTARTRVESDLRDVSRKLDAILDNTTMAVLMMDDRQHCIFMNKAAETLTGYTLAETAGRPLHDVIHHSYPDGRPFPISECAIDRALPQNAGTQGEETFVHKSGAFYPVAFTASPVRDDQNRVVGTVIEVRDISEERRSREARDLLMREVDHRARNVLAIVHSLMLFTRADDLDTYRAILTGRINALSRAQTSLANRRWEGGSLEDVVRDELEALCPRDRISISGPEISLSPEQVQPVSMLLHELATNANKYGAFRNDSGRVEVGWSLTGANVCLEWRETGGPPVAVPTREGFGSTLKNSVVRQIRGSIRRDWEATGLVVRIDFPL